MSAKDRELIARLLDAIATDDTINVVNAGDKLLDKHPKIKEILERKDWWDR